MHYGYNISCSVATDKVPSEKQEIKGLIIRVEELKMKLEDETKISKVKTIEIEQLTKQKKGKL